MTAHPGHVRDVDEAAFEREVIERSRTTPVVVDFWAAWCGPCRVLGPVLERLAAESNGDFALVKVDTDANPGLAQRYRIEGIPAVKAFRDGAVVDEFVGALPEAQVRAWLTRLVPSPADRLVAEGAAATGRGDAATAERAYRDALATAPGHTAALLGLARLLAAGGDIDAAEELLGPIPANADAQRLRARLHFQRAAKAADIPALNARIAADPRDVAAHYELGLALAGEDAYAAAIDHLLDVVRLDRAHANDGARKVVLELFGLLGDDDPRTREGRRRLSSLLF